MDEKKLLELVNEEPKKKVLDKGNIGIYYMAWRCLAYGTIDYYLCGRI